MERSRIYSLPSEDKSMDTIIEIKKVIDVDSYMQEEFGSA